MLAADERGLPDAKGLQVEHEDTEEDIRVSIEYVFLSYFAVLLAARSRDLRSAHLENVVLPPNECRVMPACALLRNHLAAAQWVLRDGS